jgi:hypothetical protein
MVRTMNGNARAFLSNRYQRHEHEEIAAFALPILMQTPGLSIISCNVTDKPLYIQAITDRIGGAVKVGDELQAGVLIQNSEVGLGQVSVSGLMYRLVRLNGLVLPDGKFAARHVGRRVEDNEALWQDDTKAADDKVVMLKVRHSRQSVE